MHECMTSALRALMARSGGGGGAAPTQNAPYNFHECLSYGVKPWDSGARQFQNSLSAAQKSYDSQTRGRR